MLLASGAAVYAWWQWSAAAARAEAQRQEREARELFEPAIEKMEDTTTDIDIDKTVRVLHEIDLALAEQPDLDTWLRFVATQDYRGVAPEALAARRDVLDVLLPLYAKQTEQRDQQALWDMTSEMLLATLSVVSVSGDLDLVSPSGSMSVDREQAQTLWRDLRDKQDDRKQLQRDIDALQRDLLDVLLASSEVYYNYLEEWDRLSMLRDRAYLAVNSEDWAAAKASAQAAVDLAPHDREAHLLLALSMIELGGPESLESATEILDTYVAEHPDATAPALLLLGVAAARSGRADDARLLLQQSAAYYPKQSEELTDMLDPYEMRAFLKKSREGGFILERYQDTMRGAGYFSPDLQMAKIQFDSGDFAGGRAKVLDHFARRRAQQQWEFVLSDVEFCRELLGPQFWQIFPEESYLDLVVSKALMGSALNLAVRNRGPTAQHNATLVLALHLTDQFPGQYEVLAAPSTVPEIGAHAEASFGSVEVSFPVEGGEPKTVDDIVQHRAILVSDEAVSWVDTDEFKLAAADAERDARRTAITAERASDPPLVQRFPEFKGTFERVTDPLVDGVPVVVDTHYGADDVRVELPRALAMLRPTFRLRVGDQLVTATTNEIEGDVIRLVFAGAGNFDKADAPAQDVELVILTPFGEAALEWTADGTAWSFGGLQRR